MARPVTPETLVTLLASAWDTREGDMIMAADGDGTLWRGDVGEDLFEIAVEEGLLKPAALGRLRAEAEEHGLSVDAETSDDASRLGAALLRAHRAGRYPNAPAFAMMAWAFAGFREAELDALCERVLDARGFEGRLRAELAPTREWAAQIGVSLWLVSASPLCIARAAGRRMGIADEHVVAMTPRVEAGLLQPELGPEATYRDGKLRRLRAETDAFLLAGFGDSYWDLALIENAVVGVAVAPNERLRERMAELEDGYVLDAT